ncbi:MAG TPA: DUF2199 domain-containing protein [Pyrinomonadaceae bacterium]|nr:DUF2199 domain-containing protein [Pyrinomonadaceae bacterium]
MSDTVICDSHGETEATFVCSHLAEGSAGVGFNRDEPTEEDPFPDAFCNDCDLILEAHHGWTEEVDKLIEARLLCSRCYELCRIRNTRTDVSFEDLSSLRWKCGTCEEWHYGPCLDFGYDCPLYWTSENDEANQVDFFDSDSEGLPTTFLDTDVCVIDGEHYFVRGVIHLPIIGTTETLTWGVWGSLSRQNFEKVLLMNDDPKRVELPSMFSWLSNRIDEYPDTLNLKMQAHIQEPGTRPIFELERTDHPLSQEYHHGVTPERVREIMMHQLDMPVD